MKISLHTLSTLLLALLFTQELCAKSEIKLTGRKDLVLSLDSRLLVLEEARSHLSEKSDSFHELVASVDSPFVFEQPLIPIIRDEQGEPVPVEEVVVNYDDASVLRVVARNFSKQVRGTLTRGNSGFLQLTGGSLVKQGTSFPVSLPQAQGQTFTVTIIEITSNSYTLKLGEATELVGINATGSSSGAIKID
ncbi:hypothetical protein SH580_16535 [Coraliomargarita algicola]|uniref:Uncharacterized protein n=1 Tax=Coraliomargarita algicola TaxID=3092156 RepID=A0ABZ0RHP6_9BACT|nr:hypothetical protein [Coraliomargarita sp. J2-16]WPJ95037.1 hypothetical protein SH580_16535 [Coraliomargarita sp. J2-16]